MASASATHLEPLGVEVLEREAAVGDPLLGARGEGDLDLLALRRRDTASLTQAAVSDREEALRPRTRVEPEEHDAPERKSTAQPGAGRDDERARRRGA